VRPRHQAARRRCGASDVATHARPRSGVCRGVRLARAPSVYCRRARVRRRRIAPRDVRRHDVRRRGRIAVRTTEARAETESVCVALLRSAHSDLRTRTEDVFARSTNGGGRVNAAGILGKLDHRARSLLAQGARGDRRGEAHRQGECVCRRGASVHGDSAASPRERQRLYHDEFVRATRRSFVARRAEGSCRPGHALRRVDSWAPSSSAHAPALPTRLPEGRCARLRQELAPARRALPPRRPRVV
jgi:hypothetical protein